MARAARLALLLLALACAGPYIAAAEAPAREVEANDALGIFADADAIPEVKEPAFVGTVFVPNDVGAAPLACSRSLCVLTRRTQRLRRSYTRRS